MYLDEVDEDSTDFAYAGDFVCWRSGRTCDKLLIYNVITQEEKEFLLDNFSIPVNDQNQNSDEIQLTDQLKDLKMNAVIPRQHLLNGCHELKDLSEMEEFSNHLQLTVADEAIILDLNGAEVLPIKELADFKSYSNPENYPVAGF